MDVAASGSNSGKHIRSVDKPVDEKNSMASSAACNPGSEVAGGEPEVDTAENDRAWEEPNVGATNVSDGDQGSGMEIVLALGKGHEESPSVVQRDRNSKIVMEKLESTAENDIETPVYENACGRKTKIAAFVSANRGETTSEQDDEFLPIDKTLTISQSLTASKIQRDEKGKAKAVSDGDGSDRMLNEEEGSHESVESCNSTRLFSTGKRQWNFDQQLIAGSKRVRRQIQESPSSFSLVKQDSSFVNWISNMMKGLSKSSKGESPSLSPAFANSDHGHGSTPDQLLSPRNEDPGCRTIGFQSIFRSLYRQKTKGQESVSLNVNHQAEGWKELEVYNKVCDTNATPIAFLPSNERFNETAYGNKSSPAVHYRDVYMNFAAIQENKSSNANGNPCNLAIDKERDGARFSSCQGKQAINSVEKTYSEQPSKGKTACNFGSKGELSASLWIARFTSKASGPLSNRDLSGKSTRDCSADGLNDALKHITQPNERDNAADHITMTCFFCGRKGHHVQECSEIPESELEDLLRNINSFGGVKELPCLCIKCFQPNHWAVACSTRNQAKCDASLVNQSGPSKMLLDARNEDNIKPKDAAGGVLTVCYTNDSTWKSNKAVHTGNTKLNVEFFEKAIDSSSVERRLKEKLMVPSHELNYGQISNVPKGIFDAIRKIRLLRTDILKWKNSHTPFYDLAGFFLRLRLGKWEEGLGGTGYYVACITECREKQMESSLRKSEKRIAVNVGGIKCLVESQYVSNHDFLEDELLAWWSATSRSGGKLPSEEELRLKFEEKKMLEF